MPPWRRARPVPPPAAQQAHRRARAPCPIPSASSVRSAASAQIRCGVGESPASNRARAVSEVELQRSGGLLHRPVAGGGGGEVCDPGGAHEQIAAAHRPAQPLLARGGVEVTAQLPHVDGHGAEPLGAVQQHRDAGGGECGGVGHAAGEPGDVRAGDQAGARAARRRPARRREPFAPLRPAPCAAARAAPAGPDAPRRRSGSRRPAWRSSPPRTAFTPSVVAPVSASSAGWHPISCCHLGPQLVAQLPRAGELRGPSPALGELSLELRGRRFGGGPRHRPDGPGVQVLRVLEHRGRRTAGRWARPGY